METFTFKIKLRVAAQAFDEEDAKDLLYDYFGPGSDGDNIEIQAVEIDPIGK